MKWFLISVAAVCGALLRVWTVEVFAQRGETFPFGTLAVNLLGCFAAGFLFAIFERQGLSRNPATNELWRAVIFGGFLGALTTFSAYGVQVFSLMQAGAHVKAVIYLLGSNVGGIAVLAVGYLTATMLFK